MGHAADMDALDKAEAVDDVSGTQVGKGGSFQLDDAIPPCSL